MIKITSKCSFYGNLSQSKENKPQAPKIPSDTITINSKKPKTGFFSLFKSAIAGFSPKREKPFVYKDNEDYLSEIGKDLEGEELKRFNALKKQGISTIQAVEIAKSSEKYSRFKELTDKTNPFKFQRPLTLKEVTDCIFAKISNSRIRAYLKFTSLGETVLSPCSIPDDNIEIKRMFELMLKNKNGESRLSRLLNFEEAKCVATSGFDDTQAQRLIDIIAKHTYTSEKKRISLNLAKEFVLLEKSDDEIEQHCSLARVGVPANTAREFSENAEKYERFNEIYALNEKSFFSQKLNCFEIERMAQSLLEISQVERYIQISKRNPMMCLYAVDIAGNDDYFQRYKELIKDENSKHYRFERKLTNDEVLFAIKYELTDFEIETFIKLCNENGLARQSAAIIKNKGLYQRYEDLKNAKVPYGHSLSKAQIASLLEKGYDNNTIESFAIFNGTSYNKELIHGFSEDFTPYKGIESIDELKKDEKQDLLRKIMKHNSKLFIKDAPKESFPLIPKDKDEYCAILSQLTEAIELTSPKLSDDENEEFFTGLKNLIRDIKTANIDNMALSLDYETKDFISDVWNKISKFDEKSKEKVFNYYNFRIENGSLEGYPTLNEGEITDSKEIESIRKFVQRYHLENGINCSNKAIEEDLNKILKGFFEFKTEINKKQHETHKYSLDKHTLKVVQSVVSDENFKKLSEDDQKVLAISSILHDISKRENKIDPNHPQVSANIANKMVRRLNLSEDDRLKIYKLIKTHDWLKRIGESKDEEKAIEDIAFETRFLNTFELAKILCASDLKSVNDSFYPFFKNQLTSNGKRVENCISEMKKSQIFLPQSHVPKANEIKNGQILSKDGISNTVLYLDDMDEDLSKYGFSKNTNKDDLYLFVHSLYSSEQLENFSVFKAFDDETLLSASYISPNFFPTYRRNGLILDIHPSNIHTGYYKDIHSGYEKNLKAIKERYLFPNKNNAAFSRNEGRYRKYVSDLIKEKTGLNDEEYLELSESFNGRASFAEIKNENIKKGIKEAINAMFMATSKSGQYSWNEFLISNPKVQGVFSKEENYENIPLFLRKYAQDNNLPILIFGKKQQQ